MKLSEFKQNIAAQQNLFLETDNSGAKVKNLESILDVVKNINGSLILDEVLALVLTHAIKLTKSERGFIVLKNKRGELDFMLGLDAKGIKLPEKSFSVSNSVVEDVFESGESKFIEGALSDTSGNRTQSIVHLKLQTILCSPLITADTKIGVIYVDSKYLRKINIKEITYTFEILAGQAAIAIRNAQTYKELNRAKQKAEASDRLKSEFLSQMSHEIRSPINVILSYTSLIKDELKAVTNDTLSLCFQSIENGGKRLIRTIDSILNMSSIQTGNVDIVMREIDVPRSMDSLRKEYLQMAKNKSIELTLNSPEQSLSVKADEYSFTQIFQNLIDNAIKFTEEGAVEINVEKNENSNELMIEVKDTGIGIDAKFIPNLFNPFSQEESGYTRKYDGSGLGLSLVKKYCDLNFARIQVDSEKGVGTSFKVFFNN